MIIDMGDRAQRLNIPVHLTLPMPSKRVIPFLCSVPLPVGFKMPRAYLCSRGRVSCLLDGFQLVPDVVKHRTWYQFSGTASAAEDDPSNVSLLVVEHCGEGQVSNSCSNLITSNQRIALSNCSETTLLCAFRSDSCQSEIFVESPLVRLSNGIEFRGVLGRPVIKRSGKILSVTRYRIDFPSCTALRGCLDIWCWTAAGLIRWEFCIVNTQAAQHRHGLWDLGDKYSLYVQCMRIIVSVSHSVRNVYCSPARKEAFLEMNGSELFIHQESSGLPHWRHANHVNRLGRVSARFAGGVVQSSDRSMYTPALDPIIVLAGEKVLVTLALDPFWQVFPRAIRVSDKSMMIECFPSAPPGNQHQHELQPGERMRLRGIVIVSDNQLPDRRFVDWCSAPFHAVPDWTYLLNTGALAECCILSTPQREKWHQYISQIDIPAQLEVKVMRQDEYGWRHFGDVPADHEQYYYKGNLPFVSHFNNQYDLLCGLLYTLLYTKDRRLLPFIHALARHVADIDIYHTDADRPAYNHGLFWHTDHYDTAGLATHRSFSRLQGSNGRRQQGGGPSCEHLYSTGLYLYYLLSGEWWARDAVTELGEFVIACDESKNTLYRHFDRGQTGLASRTREEEYHGPGRGPGNAIETLLNAWLVTGNIAYLRKAKDLVHRCIHPKDNINALNLLDAENRWSYTVFLQAVLRYIVLTLLAKQVDKTMLYAVRSLVHYVHWMIHYERPYLDNPGLLEYPTETWPCQDLRKSLVMRWGALFTKPHSHYSEHMQAKANEIATAAWQEIERFETRYTTRPLALLLTVGFQEACVDLSVNSMLLDVVRDLTAGIDFRPPMKFLPIRARILQKLPTFLRWAYHVLRRFQERING